MVYPIFFFLLSNTFFKQRRHETLLSYFTLFRLVEMDNGISEGSSS